MNLIKQLGALAFGTRMRLLTDRFLVNGAEVYKFHGVDFEPRWFTLYYLLSRQSPMSITEITKELGFTQPAVTQIANIMIKKGIIKVVKDKTDTRKKLLALSPKGLALLPKLRPVWRGFESAVNELFGSIGYDMLEIAGKLETELDKKDLFTRVNEKIKEKQSDRIEIISYMTEYKTSFRDLNYEWLEKYFCIEDEDRRILNNPEEAILNNGGSIFFAKINDEIAGTAALINHGSNKYELAKMAVTEKAQGKQLGRLLGEEIIKKARENNGEILFLESNTRLAPAMGLYKKLGFVQVKAEKESKYARSTIKMELKLT